MKKKINLSRKRKVNLSELRNISACFTGDEKHHIGLAEASEMTRAYRKSNPNQTIAHFFGKQAILEILNQSNCVGIRIYYANDPITGRKHLIIVGAESNKNDICHGLIAERAICCPTNCGKQNLLNS
ncbi:MAG TPA: hypothetical protein VN026_03835 [Bacteroidia bacterium]|jgi:hypothetical protein|nr:hypothetical protein [Bacteroidia bacterium]